MTPLDRFNDIPDGDSYVTDKFSKYSKKSHMSKMESLKDITDKPTNYVMNADGRMVFRERKLNRMDRELTDKLTNARGQIEYDYIG